MRFLRLFLAITIGAVWASAQDSDFRLSIDAGNVSVNVSVVDSAGRPVTKLTRGDFSIFEDGVPQEIQTFESVETPYNILILVDCSGSTEADWPLMRSAVDRFASKLRVQDKISVAQFGNRLEVLLDWLPWKGESLQVNVQSNSRTCGGTDFYGAVESSIGRFRGISGRKGVVVLTDGMQTPAPMRNMVVQGHSIPRIVDAADDKDFQKTLRAVTKTDVVFYFVAVNTDLNPDEVSYPGQRSRSGNGIYSPDLIYNMQQARSRMKLLADAGGGRVVFPKNPADVAPLYEEIAREFGTAYGLWYSPVKPVDSDSAKLRTIEVRVRVPGVTVKLNRDTYMPLSK
jgi:Ca-activated chloride channel homolog